MVHTCPHCQEPHIRHLALRWASRESPAQCPGCGRLSQVLASTSSAIAVFTWLGVLGSVVLGLAWDSIALSGAGLLVVLGGNVWMWRRCELFSIDSRTAQTVVRVGVGASLLSVVAGFFS